MQEGREVFFVLPKRFLRGKFICNPDVYILKVRVFLWLVVREGFFFPVLCSAQLVAADRIYGQLAGLSPEVLSLGSLMSCDEGLQALVSQPSFRPPEPEQIAAMGCRREELSRGCALPLHHLPRS